IATSADYLEQDASRLEHTDERAFDGLLPKRVGVSAEPRNVGAELTGEGGSAADAATKAEPAQFEQLVNGYVAQGLLSKSEGVQIVQQTKERAAYARAVRLATDSPWS